MNYLYNDKELPALPEWNKTKRPYVLLVSHPGSSLGVTPYHRMYCSQSPFVWSGSYATSSPTTGYGYTTMSEGDTEWGSVYEDETATRADTGVSEKPIWSNHDILNKDGSVYLAASYPVNAETGEEIKDYAPIPILAPVIDPLSLFLGWKAGNWVARQRGKAKQQWETLFDGTVTVAEGAAAVSIGTSTEISLSNGDTIRLTVSGKAETFAAKAAIVNTVYAGNYHLWGSDYEDTGGDFCIVCKKPLGITYFVSRNAGTYSVKVEKAVNT